MQTKTADFYGKICILDAPLLLNVNATTLLSSIILRMSQSEGDFTVLLQCSIA